jgi:hypothetical protein
MSDAQTYSDIERILIPRHPHLTTRLRSLPHDMSAVSGCVGKDTTKYAYPGDPGRTATLRAHLRDIKYRLKDVPEDRRRGAIAFIATVLMRFMASWIITSWTTPVC